jgi:uncharacterized protein
MPLSLTNSRIGFNFDIMPLSIRDFKQIELVDKPIFDHFFRSDPPQASEYTFTNLFMWRKKYNPRWRIYGNCLLIILEKSDSSFAALQPVGPGDKMEALNAICQVFESDGLTPVIERVTDDFVESYVDLFRFDSFEDADNSDYVYSSEKLIKLSGNKYHRKKNHLNRFKKNYDFEYRPFSFELINEALSLQATWLDLKDCHENDSLSHEDRAICEALTNFEALGFIGGVILIDGHVQAFSFGEMLNPDTAVIHIEKANPGIDGLYTAINQHFTASAWSNTKFINREQDLGEVGLRKAKQSYYPHSMINKWIVRDR